MTITQQFAEYIHRTDYGDIPEEIHRYAKLCLLDWIGVALGGSREPLSDILENFIHLAGGNPQATIIGKGMKTNFFLAALANGTLSHALDFDDTHKDSGTHPSVCLAPAVISVGEHMNASGRDLIAAFIIGFEIAARVGAAAGSAHYDHGWHATATVGRFGATAGAAKLMGLTHEQTVNAFGIAGTQVSGLREVFGTMCKPFHAGRAAMDGVMSAALAKENFDSSPEIFEGRFGLKNVVAPGADAGKLLAGIGTDYHISNVAFKPYPSALATHSTIQAIETVKEKEKITAQDVHAIQIEFAALPFSVVNVQHPAKVLEGKFSVHQCAALAFMENRVTRDLFTLEKLNDPEVVAFRKKVKVLRNPDLKKFEAIIKIVTHQGKIYESFIPAAKGSPEDPLSFSDLKHKFMGLALPVISKENADKIVEKIRNLPEIKNINEITALCVPEHPPGV